MTPRITATVAALATAALVACAAAPAFALTTAEVASAPAPRARVVVGTTGKTVAARVTVEAIAGGASLVKRSAGSSFVVLDAPVGQSAERFARGLRGRSGVRWAQPDHIRTIQWHPSDPGYPAQWGLPTIGAETAWNVTRGGGVPVAVIDTGVDLTHPDLQASLLATGYDFVNGDADPTDDNGHGTHVAGIVAAAADNSRGGCGTAPEATLMPIKVMNKDGRGYDSDVALGIRWAADHGAKVINMSLGSTDTADVLAEAVAYAEDKDVVIAAAAGNNGAAFSAYYPAALPGVLGVAATADSADNHASFSNTGPYVDVAAPGVGIYSTYFGSRYAYMSGTSMATPFVAGALALIRARYPDYTWQQAADRLEATARDVGAPGPDDTFGHGRIDLAAAVPAVPSEVTSVAVGGEDRYGTATAASQHAFPSPAGSRTVIIATGGGFPDALGAGALAGAWDAPILLVPPPGKTTAADVYAEISRLGADRALIVGGTGVVTTATALAVGQHLTGARTVVRYGGRDRYATAQLVAAAVQDRTKSHAAFIVRGNLASSAVPADALLASPLAFHSGRPVLLVTDKGIPAATAAALKSLQIVDVTVVGSSSNVSDGVRDTLAATGATTRRIGATDPGEDSVAVASYAVGSLGMTYDGLAVATSANFADALAAGPLAGREGSVLMLTPRDALSPAVDAAIRAHRPYTSVHFLGGSGALPKVVRDQVLAATGP